MKIEDFASQKEDHADMVSYTEDTGPHIGMYVLICVFRSSHSVCTSSYGVWSSDRIDGPHIGLYVLIYICGPLHTSVGLHRLVVLCLLSLSNLLCTLLF